MGLDGWAQPIVSHFCLRNKEALSEVEPKVILLSQPDLFSC